MHHTRGWPGANIMLIVGLGVEALIFVLSAFDPPTKHEWDWSKVYPQLGVGVEGSSASQVGNIMKEAKLDPAVLKSVGDGMKKMAAQANNINDLAEKIKFYKKNDKIRIRIAEKGKEKYFKLFNEVKIAKYIIDKSLGKNVSLV